MASGRGDNESISGTAAAATVVQSHPTVTGYDSRTVILQVLPPLHFNVPLSTSHSSSAGVTARLLTTSSVSTANIQVKTSPQVVS